MNFFDFINSGASRISTGLVGAKQRPHNPHQVVQTGPIHGEGVSPHPVVIPRAPSHIPRVHGRYRPQ